MVQTIGQIPGAHATTAGEFTEGDPNQPIPATRLKAAWLNSVQRELVNMVTGMGETLDPHNDHQLASILLAHMPIQLPESTIPTTISTAGLPVYPDIQNPNHRLRVVNTGNGTVVIDPHQSFIWRGVWRIDVSAYSEAERTLTTEPNTDYHLRWRPSTGFVLCNWQDMRYNPHGAPGIDPGFDTTLDDMLIATVNANRVNQVSLQCLTNRSQHHVTWEVDVTSDLRPGLDDNPLSQLPVAATLDLQWSRTPQVGWVGVSRLDLGQDYRAYSYNSAWGVLATRDQASLVDAYWGSALNNVRWYYHLCA